MPCKKCGTERIGVKIIDAITLELHCAVCGPSYLHRYEGGWESSTERMARMRRDHICQNPNCKEPFHDYKDKSKTIRHLCNKCSVWIPENDDDDLIFRSMARHNERSPWRMRRVFQKKEE